MKTTATWDQGTKEFVIHTPSAGAQKFWITNGLLHSRWCVVFARLLIHGRDEGVHVFLVRIRNEDHTLVKGVQVMDLGVKAQSANGVDNAKISFDRVRVPREALLNKYSDVSADGVFSSSIKSRRGRFLKVADQLLSGRLCIASMSAGTCKLGVSIAIRYSHTRMALGPDGEATAPIMSFQLQQLALYPLLARCYALHFGLEAVKELYAEANPKKHALLVMLCCVIKPLYSWLAMEIGNVGRERCGGQGFLKVNRLLDVIDFSHSAATAEGDNSVLMTKVAKERLAALQAGAMPVPSGAGKARLHQLLLAREQAYLGALGDKMVAQVASGKQTLYDVWMHESSSLIQGSARAFGERYSYEAMQAAINTCEASLKPSLEALRDLYAVDCLTRDCARAVQYGVLGAGDVASLQDQTAVLCREIHDISLDLIGSFGIPDGVMAAPIAGDWLSYQSVDNRGEIHPLSKM